MGYTCKNGCGKYALNFTSNECRCDCDIPDTPYAIDCYIEDADLSSFKMCPSNCSSCDSLTLNCTSCMDGYKLDNGVCAKCPADVGCSPCKDGMYYNSGSCLRCPVNCVNCTNGGKCTVCSVGYAFNNKSRCEAHACSSPCMTCLNTTSLSNQCLSCEKGTYLDNY